MKRCVWMLMPSVALVSSAAAAAPGDTARIVDEGMNRSQVMLTAHELMDDIGPRLTISTNMRKAQDWALAKFTSYGLTNVHKEGFTFGRGWDIIGSSVRLVSPRPIQLVAIPVAWTPPTKGTLSAPVIVAPMNRPEHFAAYRGKLAGKIVMVTLPGDGQEPTDPPFHRLTSEEISKEDKYQVPHFDPEEQNGFLKRIDFYRQMDKFLASEGALAVVKKARTDGKLVFGEGYQHAVGDTPLLPTVEIAAEDYRRVARMAKLGENPVLEISNDVRYLDQDRNAYNIIADIPGSDAKSGYVMAGAHFDSWVAGDGASDNGAGSVVVMEAARILRTLGVRPKRTIRFALWSGEEQGLYGSANYVQQHLAARPGAIGPGGVLLWDKLVRNYPVTLLPGYGALKAYFNIDNGSGKVRGIYAGGNSAAVPLLRDWLSPFDAMGAGAVVAGPTTGTDHEPFQAVAIPGFQFIQDPLDYETRVHHSSIDTLDHMKGDDLRQAAVVLAGMLLQAANSDKELPRPPVPTQPSASDPFKYDLPEPK
ncbi:MAG: M20/M25/M40 family metallo-hydrolase [Sphingomonas sp.]|nr:M20/M25/M40 family metallo-hydrolase [Sphingomonas sp.]